MIQLYNDVSFIEIIIRAKCMVKERMKPVGPQPRGHVTTCACSIFYDVTLHYYLLNNIYYQRESTKRGEGDRSGVVSLRHLVRGGEALLSLIGSFCAAKSRFC